MLPTLRRAGPATIVVFSRSRNCSIPAIETLTGCLSTNHLTFSQRGGVGKDRNERSWKRVVAAIGGQHACSIDLDTVQEFLLQLIAFVDTEAGQIQERRLGHREEAERSYRDLTAQGVEGAREHGSQWSHGGLNELSVVGRQHVQVRWKQIGKQKTDWEDAQMILKLMLRDDFSGISVASWANGAWGQLLWHRHSLMEAT